MINTNYGKLVDGGIEFLRLPLLLTEAVTVDGVVHPAGAYLSTDRADVLAELGFKPIVYANMPQTEGYYYTESFFETENEIHQSWDEHENEPEPVTLTQEEYDDMTAALNELGVNPNGEMA